MNYFKDVLLAFRMKTRCKEQYITNETMLTALEAMVTKLRRDRKTDIVAAIAKSGQMHGPLTGHHDYTLTWEKITNVFQAIDLDIRTQTLLEQDELRYGRTSKSCNIVQFTEPPVQPESTNQPMESTYNHINSMRIEPKEPTADISAMLDRNYEQMLQLLSINERTPLPDESHYLNQS